jgi:hypothetical protein
MADRSSVAMTASLDQELQMHLLRADGQEDLCFATYRQSTGRRRRTALLRQVVLPQPGERSVHGNASFTGDFVLRVANEAATRGEGVALLHSHPRAGGRQGMSGPDADAERSYAHLVHAITGQSLIGMTLAGGDGAWAARVWTEDGTSADCESVRVVGDRLKVTWHDDLRPVPVLHPSQARTVSGWGETTQADLARLRVLVVGVGSVGLDVALRLAATGIEHVAVMDFDTVEIVNLDRLVGANRLDAKLQRSKIEVAARLLRRTATARRSEIAAHDLSICEPSGHDIALDYDVIFSCVDRPWPRAVLNTLAYADLIPVIDGGIGIDPFPDGQGMRSATWRTHVLRPGRPCLACNKQLDLGRVQADRTGALDDPAYIKQAARPLGPTNQNVAALSSSVSAGLLAQFVSLAVAPGGQGDPGPLRYSLASHVLEHLLDYPDYQSKGNCHFETATAIGDGRLPLTGVHELADRHRAQRRTAQRSFTSRLLSVISRGVARFGL